MTGWNLWMADGWLIAAAGLSLVLLFVFGRRVLLRRMPRCIAGGYRLDGIPAANGAVRCRECGRASGGLAEPYALGRKRWIGLLGVVLIVGGWTLASVPTARAHGWAPLVPAGLQVRLLDFSDDPDLWCRVATRATQGAAATRTEEPLRRRVLGRMLDPDGDPTPAIQAMSILGSRSNLSAPMLSPEDLARVLAEGAPQAKAYAMEQLGRVPPSPELAALRRVAWDEATNAERKIFFDGLIPHPASTEDLELIHAALLNADFSIAMTVARELSKSPLTLRTLSSNCSSMKTREYDRAR